MAMAMAMGPTVPMGIGPTVPMAMVVLDPEQVQAYHLRQFSLRAAELMPSRGDVPLESGAALAALVSEATSHPDIFNFGPLLCLPEISRLKETQYYWFFDALCIFAYGTLKDYARHKGVLPKLKSEQFRKLQHITLLTAIEARKVIPLVDIMKELGVSTIAELGGILEHSKEKLGTFACINVQRGCLEVHDARMIHRTLFSGVSLEVYFQAATTSHVDAGILNNAIVTQVQVPLSRTGSKLCWKVDFTYEGREIFIQLISLTSSGHLSQKSWNGLIYPGMFGSFRGKIFLRPGVVPYRMITDTNSMNDYGAIDHMIGEYAGLKFPYVGKSGKMEQIMFPIYTDDLRAHLQGKHKIQLPQNPGIRALDLNFITFLECHPALLTSSAKSVVFEHVRRQYRTTDRQSEIKFSAKLQTFILNSNKWKRSILKHWLFRDVFRFASRRNSPYGGSAFDRQRYIRDWETHGRESLRACLVPFSRILTCIRSSRPCMARLGACKQALFGWQHRQSLDEPSRCLVAWLYEQMQRNHGICSVWLPEDYHIPVTTFKGW